MRTFLAIVRSSLSVAGALAVFLIALIYLAGCATSKPPLPTTSTSQDTIDTSLEKLEQENSPTTSAKSDDQAWKEQADQLAALLNDSTRNDPSASTSQPTNALTTEGPEGDSAFKSDNNPTGITITRQSPDDLPVQADPPEQPDDEIEPVEETLSLSQSAQQLLAMLDGSGKSEVEGNVEGGEDLPVDDVLEVDPALVTALRPLLNAILQGQTPDDDATKAALTLLKISESESFYETDDQTGTLAELLAKIQLKLMPGLKITDARLCMSVAGFGSYEPFAELRFVAGRVQPVIVYVELTGFTHDPVSSKADAPQWEVRVSQAVTMYRDPDVQVLHKPAQPIIQRSRRQVRDFYLIQRVDLPATLSVGRYTIKVAIRDQVSGSIDERNIPFEVVEDPSRVKGWK